MNFLEINQAAHTEPNIYVDSEQVSSARVRLKMPARPSGERNQNKVSRQT